MTPEDWNQLERWQHEYREAEAALAAERTRAEELVEALERSEEGIGSLLWVMNNRHNWAHPRWDGLAASAEVDAREALDCARQALTHYKEQEGGDP